MKNKETLEEASNKFLGTKQEFYFKKDSLLWKHLISLIKFGAKWQAERSYSEEEVIDLLKAQLIEHKIYGGRVEVEQWFEQFKKDTWYNEEKTNKRMNVIGQNGNDGTHYENK